MQQKLSQEATSPDSLPSILSVQLKTCVAALDSKQPDVIIGTVSLTLMFFRRGLNLLHIAQAGGHDAWQAIMNMVKNISEVMLSSLPNFWKISRAFLDGKFKVSSCILEPIFTAKIVTGRNLTSQSNAVPYDGIGCCQTLCLSPIGILLIFRHGRLVPRVCDGCHPTLATERLQFAHNRLPSNEDSWRNSRVCQRDHCHGNQP